MTKKERIAVAMTKVLEDKYAWTVDLESSYDGDFICKKVCGFSTDDEDYKYCPRCKAPLISNNNTSFSFDNQTVNALWQAFQAGLREYKKVNK